MTLKRYLPTSLLVLVSMTCWGQTVEPAAQNSEMEQLSQIMTIMIMVSSMVLFIVSLAVLLKANTFLTKHLMRLEAERNGVVLPNDASPEAEARPVEEDFFTKLRKKYWENPVPREREGDITLGHNYDGIRELDNHLPPWWINMFALTCIWALGYMWYYHWGGEGPNQEQEYNNSVETAKKEIAIALAGKSNAVDESSVTALTDASALSEGELIYKSVCAACHGQQGEGLVGPNFTDEYWLHGGGIKNVFKVIKYGVPEKGMIAWSAQLKPVDIQKVASYILTLKGTNPPNPKAPQGEIWKEEGTASDTTKVGNGGG